MSDKLLKTRFVKIWVRLALLAFVAGLSSASITQTGSADMLPHALSQPVSPGNYLPVLSDFDGDHRLDQAELHLAGTHHCIRVRFGNFHETHLDFGTRSHSGGVLLVRDVNSDDKPDLIWAYRSRSEPTLVWLNDGAGHFAEASKDDAVDAITSLLDDTDYALTATFGDQEPCLVAVQPPFDFAAVAILDHDVREILIAHLDSRPTARLDVSNLRERGPPDPA